MTIVKRPYRSPLREAQAEATRQRILEAGLALFAERGYPGTSVAEIGRAAGVSTETVYASVGSKRGIIDALLAQVDTQGIPDRARAGMAARGGDPRAALEVLAELAAEFWSTHGTLVGVLRNGVGDPEIGEAWLARQAARRELVRTLIASWPRGTLRRGLTVDRAADIAWALTSDELFAALVGLRGWSVKAYVAWTSEALVRELLAD
jgi:AcrR family transcriptional regulator